MTNTLNNGRNREKNAKKQSFLKARIVALNITQMTKPYFSKSTLAQMRLVGFALSLATFIF